MIFCLVSICFYFLLLLLSLYNLYNDIVVEQSVSQLWVNNTRLASVTMSKLMQLQYECHLLINLFLTFCVAHKLVLHIFSCCYWVVS